MYLKVEVGAKSTRHDIPDWAKEHFPMVVIRHHTRPTI